MFRAVVMRYVVWRFCCWTTDFWCFDFLTFWPSSLVIWLAHYVLSISNIYIIIHIINYELWKSQTFQSDSLDIPAEVARLSVTCHLLAQFTNNSRLSRLYAITHFSKNFMTGADTLLICIFCHQLGPMCGLSEWNEWWCVCKNSIIFVPKPPCIDHPQSWPISAQDPLTKREHGLQLASCIYQLHKQSFVINSLYKIFNEIKISFK